jgi:predicted Zn-dependent protease with MMP-like domain
MISLPNPTSKMNDFNRDSLIQDYAQLIVEGMDMDTLVSFAYDTLVSNLIAYTDEELINEVKEYNPELLDDAVAEVVES